MDSFRTGASVSRHSQSTFVTSSLGSRLAAIAIAPTCLVSLPLAETPRQPFSRVAVTVTLDRPGWTYHPGEPVTFQDDVVRDGHPSRR